MSTSFSTWRSGGGGPAGGRPRLADLLDLLTAGPLPFAFSAYDGSRTGPPEAPVSLHLARPRGAAYLATAPGSLGLARAYIAGDLIVHGVQPGDPYPLLRMYADEVTWRRGDPKTAATVVRALGPARLVPPPPPPQEVLPDWRRALEGLRHSKRRDA